MAAAGLGAGILIVSFLLGNRFYIVRSGSMEPAIHTGDLAVVSSRYDYDRLVPGDIIAYMASNGARVTHRILTVSDKGIETCGDANSISDGIAVNRNNYLGKEWLAIPKLGYISAAVLSRKGRIIIITAAAAMIIISLFPGESDKRRKGEGRREKTA